MTNPLTDKNLTRGRLRQLIERANQDGILQETPPDAEDLDWQQPHRFDPETLVTMDVLANRFSEYLARTFNVLCQGEFEITVSSITQHFACTIAAEITTEQREHYFQPFAPASDGNKNCGFLSIPPESATVLTGHMLQDYDIGARAEQKLSELEETILTDLTVAIVEAFAETLKDNAGPAIQTSQELVKGKWPLNFNEFENLITIEFDVNHPEGAAQLAFTVLSEIIEPALGIKAQVTQQLTDQNARNLIMRHIYEVPVDVSVRLTSASMNLSDIMNLDVGDVLLLEKKINEPSDVLLNDRTCLRGYPATSSGKYAVVIE
ncbi:MAG: FliM/FliN family flagellar motor switch protein [Planctomycetota bacterium]|jgi:flagellar motor switch protein FliM